MCFICLIDVFFLVFLCIKPKMHIKQHTLWFAYVLRSFLFLWSINEKKGNNVNIRTKLNKCTRCAHTWHKREMYLNNSAYGIAWNVALHWNYVCFFLFFPSIEIYDRKSFEDNKCISMRCSDRSIIWITQYSFWKGKIDEAEKTPEVNKYCKIVYVRYIL